MTQLKGTTYSIEEIKALRTEAGLSETVNLHSVASVVDRVGGDFDLALTALTQVPRPDWVCEALGVHPERKVGA